MQSVRWATVFRQYLHQQNLSFELLVVRKSSKTVLLVLLTLPTSFLRDPESFQHLREKGESEIGVGGDVGKCHR